MNRVRISTTVDATSLAHARRLTGRTDAQMIDAALRALIVELEAERDLAALERWPYAADEELKMPDSLADEPDALLYNGEVPAEVLRLAKQRRKKQ